MVFSSKNETIFTEILPELARIFENRYFSDSLNIYIEDVRILNSGEEDDVKKRNSEDVVFKINEFPIAAKFKKCQAIRQQKMSTEEEMMFGVFGENDHSVSSPLSSESEILLNPRLIIPQYTVIPVRNYSIPKTRENSNLISTLAGLFGCPTEKVKISQKSEKSIIFLHVDLEKEQKTSRSSIFEAIYLLIEFFGSFGNSKNFANIENFEKINKLIMPFVHFGKVRISIDSHGNAKIFNLFGSLFGILKMSHDSEDLHHNTFITEDMIQNSISRNSEDVVEEDVTTSEVSKSLPRLLDILQNQMRIKVADDVTPLPYLGVDSLRLAELEFHVANSEFFRELELKSPFLIEYKSLKEVAMFLDRQICSLRMRTNSEDVRIDSDDVRGGSEDVKVSLEVTRNSEDIGSDSEALKSISHSSSNKDHSEDVKSSEFEMTKYSEDVKYRIPLSSQQKRILFISEFEKSQSRNPGTQSQFIEPIAIKLPSEMTSEDVERLQNILNVLIIRHSILRTGYKDDYQYLLSGTESHLVVLERSGKLEKEVNSEYDLSCYMTASEGLSRLQLNFHHIMIDGRSLAIFYQQFLELYRDQNDGKKKRLQYYDYCRLEQSKENNQEDVEFWSRYLQRNSEEEDPEDVETLFPTPSSPQASRLFQSLPKNLYSKLHVISLNSGLSTFELFLHTLSSTIRHVFGISHAFTIGIAQDRREFEFHETIGCFTNVLPFVTSSDSSTTSDSSESIQKTLRSLRSHGGLSYQKIKTFGGKMAEFEVFLVSDIVEVKSKKKSVRFSDDVGSKLKIVTSSERSSEDVIAKYPMTWYWRQNSEGVEIEVEYMKECVDEETVKFLVDEVMRAINNYPNYDNHANYNNNNQRIKKSDFPQSTVIQLSSKLSYRYLDQSSSLMSSRTCHVARQLLKSHVKLYGQRIPEHPVLIKLPRAPELLEVLFATWHAGFYPVPLHWGSGEGQIQKIKEGLGAKKALLVDLEVMKDLTSSKFSMNGEPRRLLNSFTLHDICYVTSTSGSTGIPKLVATAFHGHSNLMLQYTKTFHLNSEDVICQTVDPSFDIFFADVFKALVNGARLLLCQDQIPSSSELQSCSNAYLMPALIPRISKEMLGNLSRLQFGGEPLSSHVLQSILKEHKGLRIYQEYGLTEQTVYSMYRRILKGSRSDRQLGAPYDNIGATINAPRICHQAQLTLTGVGIMRGYFGITRNVLKALDTGDVVRRDGKGRMEFVGRKDAQVKVRGHRVDLFEIESITLSSNLCQFCACIFSPVKKELVLFYTLKSSKSEYRSESTSKSEDINNLLKTHLEKELVSYKVPNRLVCLEKLPLTRTGKIDRKALQKTLEDVTEHSEVVQVSQNSTPPESHFTILKSLRKWLEHYSESRILSDDVDIFASGVDSISAMLTMQKMRSEGVDAPIRVFFEQKTLERIGRWIQEHQGQHQKNSEVIQNSELIQKSEDVNYFIDLNHVQQRILFLSRITDNSNVFRMQFSIPFESSEDVKILNTVIQNNTLIRSKIARQNGEFKFHPLSATESFWRVTSSESPRRRQNQFDTFIWIDSSKKLLMIDIHHIICDGRSLQILKTQIEKLSEKSEDVKFENNFRNFNSENSKNSEDVKYIQKLLNPNTFQFIPKFPAFKYGSKCSRIHIDFRSPTSSSDVFYFYGKALRGVFNDSELPIACTFANRSTENWNTVGMFANTLPVVVTSSEKSGSSEDIVEFRRRLQKINECSNVPLTTILTSSSSSSSSGGPFADFAINFHKSLDSSTDSEDVAQFAMLLTYSEAQNAAILEFDKSLISRRVAEDVREILLKLTNPAPSLDYQEAFRKFIGRADSEDVDFFASGGHSLTAMKLMDHLSDELRVELPLKMIFENPTPRRLREAVEKFRRGDDGMQRNVKENYESHFDNADHQENAQNESDRSQNANCHFNESDNDNSHSDNANHHDDDKEYDWNALQDNGHLEAQGNRIQIAHNAHRENDHPKMHDSHSQNAHHHSNASKNVNRHSTNDDDCAQDHGRHNDAHQKNDHSKMHHHHSRNAHDHDNAFHAHQDNAHSQNAHTNDKSHRLSFHFPLSRQQLQMFYLSESTSSLEYQLPFIQPFPSTVTPSAIHQSLLFTMQEQSIFRTAFFLTSSDVHQEVLSITECFIACHVEYVSSTEQRDLRIKELCHEPIEVLSGAPLLRATFLTSSEFDDVAILHLHHLISDARSTQLTNSTMRKFLSSQVAPKRKEFHYVDYCSLQKAETLNSEVTSQETSEYIESLLNGIHIQAKNQLETRNFPMEPSKAWIDVFKIKIPTSSESPFSLFLRATSQILQEKLHVANLNLTFPILNRTAKTSEICGYFLNNLIINSNQIDTLSTVIQSNLPYSELISLIRKRGGVVGGISEVYVNCRYDLEYDASDDVELLELVPMKLHFPVELDIDWMDGFWRLTMRSRWFSREEVVEMLERIRVVVEVEKSSRMLKNTIIRGPKKDYPSHTLPQLYHQFLTSSSSPSSSSSKFAEVMTSSKSPKSLTYSKTFSQLHSLSSQIHKKFLRSKCSSLRADDVIGIVSEKSVTTTILCLSVQYSGAAYLPVDKGYPDDRKKEILKAATWIFENSDLEERSIRRRHWNLATSESLAYIITTSGTTGTPKSVAINGYSVANLALCSTIHMLISRSSRLFQFTNFVFDNSVLEVVMTISSGATLLYPEGPFDPARHLRGVSHCLLFPSLVASFSSRRLQDLQNLEYWIVGGERLPQRLLEDVLQMKVRVIQNYGPTETTAFCLLKRMKKGDIGANLGRPAMNCVVRVDSGDDSGELLISGAGRMRGYLHQDQNQKASEWYHSGDIGKISNGHVEFIGRTDSQIKIRGYRVELSEIESTIESLPLIATCKAYFQHDTQQIHVFYTTTSQSEFELMSSELVREHCRRALEPHKIPSSFTKIHEFPLTNNSKIDKEELMKMRVENVSRILTNEAETLKNTTTSTLSNIWKSLLNCTPSESDHFFLIGGHSLLLIRLRHQIEEKLGVHLTIPELLENLQFSQMVKVIVQKKVSSESNQKSDDVQKTLIFFPALYGGCTGYLKLVEELKSHFKIILLDEEFGDTVDDVAFKYRSQIERKVTVTQSTVYFLGASSAGTFAHATWLQYLQATVILLDTGTFWNLIDKLDYRKHENDMLDNLKNYQVDQKTASEMAKSSWKTLQILKNYRPQRTSKFDSSSPVKMHILSVDGTDLGWSQYSDNLKVHRIPGDHYSMLQNLEHVQEIVNIVLSL